MRVGAARLGGAVLQPAADALILAAADLEALLAGVFERHRRLLQEDAPLWFRQHDAPALHASADPLTRDRLEVPGFDQSQAPALGPLDDGVRQGVLTPSLQAGGKTQKLDYVICFPDRCVAETQLSDQLVASFKKGQELTLTSVNFQNQPNPIKVSLSGFTGAYDGAPLQQSDIEDRQKKLQEFVNKNNQDFAKKLKEEQEKAKAAN